VLVLNAPGGGNVIASFRIAGDGSLHAAGMAGALPATGGGLATS